METVRQFYSILEPFLLNVVKINMNSYICPFTFAKTFANKEGALDKFDLFPQIQAYSTTTTI
jgi:hypothetical protein